MKNYIKPEIEVKDINLEGMICLSALSLDDENSSTSPLSKGNFAYGEEEPVNNYTLPAHKSLWDED